MTLSAVKKNPSASTGENPRGNEPIARLHPLPLPNTHKQYSLEEHSLQYRAVVESVLTDFFNTVLDKNESEILRFIVSRTIRFGKMYERMAVNEFLQGVYTEAGTIVTAPVRMGRSTLVKTLTHMVSAGWVKRKQTPLKMGGYRVFYAINFLKMYALCKAQDLPEFVLNRLSELSGILIGGKNMPHYSAKLGEKVPENRGPKIGLGGSKNWTLNNIEEEVEKSKSKPSVVLRRSRGRNTSESIEETLAAVTAITKAKREAKEEKAQQWAKRGMSSVTFGVFKTMWTKFYLQHYANVPVVHLTGQQFAILKRNFKSSGLSGSDLVKLVEWTIANWSSILARRNMQWLRTKNLAYEVPSMSMFSRYIRYFAEVWVQDMSEAKMARGELKSISPQNQNRKAEELQHKMQKAEDHFSEVHAATQKELMERKRMFAAREAKLRAEIVALREELHGQGYIADELPEWGQRNGAAKQYKRTRKTAGRG